MAKYELQSAACFKQNGLKPLTTIGKIELPEFEAILGSEKKVFYRNKMEFSFSNSRWLTEKRN
jgi:23S rRNA (uracil1939-C5)-methyltransferase